MRARSVLFAVGAVTVVVLAIAVWPSRSPRVPGAGLSAAPQAGESSARTQSFATDAEQGRLAEIPATAAPPAGASTAIPSVPLPDDPTAVPDERPTRPVCRSVPVLPAVPDITADSCSNPLNVADVLEQEQRDPGWAADMEARIRDAIGGLEGLALARLEVECRTTSCGIVLVHAEGADSNEQRSRVTERVRDAFRFQQWGGTADLATADGKLFSTITLMRAAGREQLWPAPPAIAALPGVAGVEVPLLGIPAIDDAHPAKLLAEEVDDAEWARPMESRVTEQMSSLAPKNWYQSYVGCRSTICGVVLLYPAGTDVDVGNVDDAVAEELGFISGAGQSYERETGTLVTIYLRR